jgi:hypothetical protein
MPSANGKQLYLRAIWRLPTSPAVGTAGAGSAGAAGEAGEAGEAAGATAVGAGAGAGARAEAGRGERTSNGEGGGRGVGHVYGSKASKTRCYIACKQIIRSRDIFWPEAQQAAMAACKSLVSPIT